MKFMVTLRAQSHNRNLPINYQYPLSAAIYRIISKGDAEYADFLHERGYGKKDKGFKFFTFSQLNAPFKIEGDRLRLTSNEANFQVAFHLPQAMESFVKGLFQSEEIIIADKKSKVSFSVKSVESLPNPLQQYKENELVNITVKPLSPIVAGLQNEKGNYDFLSPEDPRFVESLVFNWRSKIATCYDDATGSGALLMMEVVTKKPRPISKPIDGRGKNTNKSHLAKSEAPKSRLITIKADTEAETKIRGWMNFELKITGEKRFVELLLNAGAGVYNSMGCGCVEGLMD